MISISISWILRPQITLQPFPLPLPTSPFNLPFLYAPHKPSQRLNAQHCAGCRGCGGRQRDSHCPWELSVERGETEAEQRCNVVSAVGKVSEH